MSDGAEKDSNQDALDKVEALHKQSGGAGGWFSDGMRAADFVNDPALWAKEYAWMMNQCRAIARQAHSGAGSFALQGLSGVEEQLQAILDEIKKLTTPLTPQTKPAADAAVKALQGYITAAFKK